MRRKVTSIVTATAAMVVIAALLALPASGAAPNPIVRIRANGSNSAAVRAGGDLRVWGYNYVGQVGDGTKENNRNAPINVQGIGKVVDIAVGYTHTLALAQDGSVYAWGDNEYGQLGVEGCQCSTVPVKVLGLEDVVAISAAGHSIALKSDGTVWCWGDGRFGQLGNGARVSKPTPVRAEALGDVVFVEAAWYMSYAVKSDGTLWVWGQNASGQLGRDLDKYIFRPVRNCDIEGVHRVTGGMSYSIALKEDGTVWTWGKDEKGQLGDKSFEGRAKPVKVTMK